MATSAELNKRFTNKSVSKEYNIVIVLGGQGGDEGKGKVGSSLEKIVTEDDNFAFTPFELKMRSADFDFRNLPQNIMNLLGEYAIRGKDITPRKLSKLKKFFLGEDFDTIHAYHVRMNGGKNGGHSLELKGKEKFTAHQIPAGIMYENVKSVIGAGCAFDPVALINEIKEAKSKEYFNGKLVIDDLAEVGFRAYDVIDGARSGKKSTGSGIRNIYGHRGMRDGIKVRDLVNNKELERKLKELVPFCHNEYRTVLEQRDKKKGNRYFGQNTTRREKELAKFKREHSYSKIHSELLDASKKIKKYVSADIHQELQMAAEKRKMIFVEASQSIPLGIDSGYENASSSAISSAAFFSKQHIPYKKNAKNTLVMTLYKTHNTRVGEAVFVGEWGDRSKAMKKAELLESLGFSKFAKREAYGSLAIEMMRSKNMQTRANGHRLYYNEFGETTQRPRGISPLDLVVMRTSSKQEGSPYVAINMMDGLEHLDEIEIITHYKDRKGNLYSTVPRWHDSELRKLKPVFVKLKSWKNKCGDNYHKWDNGAKAYINFIQEKADVRVICGGYGAQNHQNAFINPSKKELQIKAKIVKAV